MAFIQNFCFKNVYFQEERKILWKSSPEENMTKEEKPETPAVKGDQITNVIGEVGRWQIEKILIVFFASAPGKYNM